MLDEIRKNINERLVNQPDSRFASPDEVRICWLLNEIDRLHRGRVMKKGMRVIFVEKCNHGDCPYFDYETFPGGMVVSTVCRHTESIITSRAPGQDQNFPDMCQLKEINKIYVVEDA